MYVSPAPSRATINRFRPVPGLHGMFVVAVSCLLSVAGAGVGFLIGAMPYFLNHSTDYARLDLFFAQSLVVGTMLGIIVGCANGTRWYHANDVPGWVQRRLTRYLRGHAVSSSVAQRTISISYLQRLRAMQGD